MVILAENAAVRLVSVVHGYMVIYFSGRDGFGLCFSHRSNECDEMLHCLFEQSTSRGASFPLAIFELECALGTSYCFLSTAHDPLDTLIFYLFINVYAGCT